MKHEPPTLSKKFEEVMDIRKEMIRQDRFSTMELDAKVRIGSTFYDVLNCTPFGIAIISDHFMATKLELDKVDFLIDGVVTQQLQLKEIRRETETGTLHKIAFEIVSVPLEIEVVVAAHYSSDAVASFYRVAAHYETLPQKFRHLTLDLKENFLLLKTELDALEERLQSSSGRHTDLAEKSSITVLAKSIEKFVEPKLDLISKSLGDVDSEIRKECYIYFRDHISSLLNLAPFSERSLAKPLGYAGDFEIMNMIYRDEPLGKTLFAKALHKYMINMSGGKAVRNRAKFLKQKIEEYFSKGKRKERAGRLLSLASGPAVEIQLLLSDHKDGKSALNLSELEFNFLDRDQSALKHAQRQLKSLSLEAGVTLNTHFIDRDVKEAILRGLDEGEYDFIYSAGLFDYFSDSTAIRAAKMLVKQLKPGGQLVIGNFDLGNPSRLFMELAWDWNLVYRSAEDLDSIFGSLGKKRVVETEPERVNLFYVISN